MNVLLSLEKGLETMENPPCTVYGLKEKKEFETITEAVNYAKEEGYISVIELAGSWCRCYRYCRKEHGKRQGLMRDGGRTFVRAEPEDPRDREAKAIL